MLLNITLLLIISLPIFITISTVINKEVKYTVATQKQTKTGILKRKAPVPSHWQEGNIEQEKTVTKKHLVLLLLR